VRLPYQGADIGRATPDNPCIPLPDPITAHLRPEGWRTLSRAGRPARSRSGSERIAGRSGCARKPTPVTLFFSRGNRSSALASTSYLAEFLRQTATFGRMWDSRYLDWTRVEQSVALPLPRLPAAARQLNLCGRLAQPPPSPSSWPPQRSGWPGQVGPPIRRASVLDHPTEVTIPGQPGLLPSTGESGRAAGLTRTARTF